MRLKFVNVIFYAFHLCHVTKEDLVSWHIKNKVDLTAEEALGQMSGKIAAEYFTDFYCTAVVTEINNSNSDYIYDYFPNGIVPTIHISFSRKTENSKGYLEIFYESAEDEYTFEKLILASLNERCLGYIVQVPDLRFMVDVFTEITRWASQRVNRYFLYLPTVSGASIPTSEEWNTDINDIFSLRAMDFMPDLVVAKFLERNSEYVNEERNNASPGENDFVQCMSEDADCLQDAERSIEGDSVERRRMKKFKSQHDNLDDIDIFEDISENSQLIIQESSAESLSSEYHFELVTHKFIWPQPEEQIFLDIWEANIGFVKGTNLYPDKITNLMGKPFIITTVPYPPFAVLDIEIEPPLNDGFEFRVVYEYVKKHNMSYKGVYDLDNWWGKIWPNGSGMGLTGMVAIDEADIGFAAVYLWNDEYRFTDYSHAYGWSGITVVAPKPVMLPGLMVPVLPFAPEMWMAVGVYLVVITFVLYGMSNASQKFLGGNIANRYSTLVECIFRTLGLLVLQVPDDERDQSVARHVPMRHLVNWLILQFLVITTAYGGGLAMVLTLPRFTPPIETKEDLASSGLHWSALDGAFVFGIKESPDPVLRTLTRNFYVGSEEELNRRTRTGDMAFVVERLQGGRFALPPHITEEAMAFLRLMKEDIFWGHCVFMVRKGTPHMEKFNQVVNHLKEAGITLHWEVQVVREFLSERQQLSVILSRAPLDVGPTKLLLDHVQGAYILLFLGLGLGFITFFVERIYSRLSERAKKKTSFWKNIFSKETEKL